MSYNLIYIAGYGRSGTTLLDRILNTSDEIFSTGEIVHIFDTAIDRYISICGCKERQDKCIFWRDIIYSIKEFIEKNGGKTYLDNLFKKIEGINGIFYKPTRKEIDLYLEYNKMLFDLIYKKSKTRYISDSSKTAWSRYKRVKYLKEIYPDMKVIHLKRDANATAYSNIRNYYGIDFRNSYKREFIYFKSIISWIFANKVAFSLKDKNYLFIQYENFVTDVQGTIEKLNRFLNLKSKIDLSKINDVNHIYTGNASRHKTISSLKIDNEYKQYINFLERNLSNILIRLAGL